MSVARISELRTELQAERLSWGELAEIQSAYEELGEPSNPEDPALAGEMLDALEAAA